MLLEHLNTQLRTLRGRLLLWISVAVFLMVGITMLVIRAEFRRALFDEFDLAIKTTGGDVSSTLRHYGDPNANWQDPLNRKAHNLNYFIEIFDESGHRVWTTDSDTMPESVPPPVFPSEPPPPKKQADGTLKTYSVPQAFSDTDTYRLYIRKRRIEDDEKRQPVLWFRIGMNKTPVLESVAKLDRIMFLASLGIVVFTPLAAYLLAGRATRPVAKIISTTGRLNPENLHERLVVRGTGDELDRLSETINKMLDRIASYIDRHRDFIADAAHELRSPLTAIRSSVEVALNRPRSTEEYQSLLFDVMEECSGLATLVNRLLFLAEGDAGRLSCRDQTAHLDKLVRESVDMFQAVAETGGIELVAENFAPAVVRGDGLHIRQVVRNLIDNAVKFTTGPGRVTIAVRTDPVGKQAILTVKDTGRGIPAEDLPRIFGRFYRADKARTRFEGGGFGLGLSICQSVVQSLGGQIRVESELGHGSTFTVTLPLAAELAPAELATAFSAR